MDVQDTQHTGNAAFFITLDDVRQNSWATRVYPSLEAIYVHFLLSIKSSHRVGVQISIIPFSIRGFPGQVFYFAEGAFARCCGSIHQEDFLTQITDVAESIYNTSVSWHKWNLRAPGFWSELAHHGSGSLTHSQGDTCVDTVSRRLQQLIVEAHSLDVGYSPGSLVLVDEGDVRRTLPTGSTSPERTRTSSSVTTESTESAVELERPLKRSRNERRSSIVEPMMGTADTFLERLSSASISDAEVSSYIALTNVESPPTTPYGENVSRAWEMCISFARQSSQKLKYSRFLRFLSLCFFLIWEKYSEKQGKIAARLVNAKMREAGFSGHSRGLKTMRDETTLINRIIASIQESCGFEKAGILYHIVFEASNYQLVRTINRLGNDKKAIILEYMCKNMQIDALSAYPSTALNVQGIIQQYLPNLSVEAINAAIGYQPIERSRTASMEGLAGIQESASNDSPTHLKDHPSLTCSNGQIGESDSPYVGFNSRHIFGEDGSGSALDAIDMLPGNSFLQFPGDVDAFHLDFPFNDISEGMAV